MYRAARATCALILLLAVVPAAAEYVNFEASHVHPIDLTPSGDRLLAVNTPDATLEIFTVLPDGGLAHERSIPVGLDPVSVVARSDGEAWVVNQISDSVDVVDLGSGLVTKSLPTGDEPSDVAFAAGKAFVAVAGEDAVRVFDLGNLDAAPVALPILSRKPRALAVSNDGSHVYVVALFSGNQTAVINENELWDTGARLNGVRLAQLGLNDMACVGTKPDYPPRPVGVERASGLPDPHPGDPTRPDQPKTSLIVRWNESAGEWQDETGANWNACLPFRLPDHDLFVIDAADLTVSEVDHLGTSLFEVSVHPANGKIYVPHTEARNLVRFEHANGVQGHVVDNRLAIVDPSDGYSVTTLDLNAHIDRASDPQANLAERLASISQPGMLVWNATGTAGYLTAIGSRKLFRIDGSCTGGDCIFGPNRAAPQAVEVGEGPTGVALHEAHERLYVLNRFDNSIAVVDSTSLAKLEQLPLHDPSPAADKLGRRFLYDAILGSGHGDSACSSCHISGDRDNSSWDLGDPSGAFVPYTGAGDNVRFIVPVGGEPTTCPDPLICASRTGFDPEKGPMATQSLRGMLEPLHWRGDRPRFQDFNKAFVGLMGTADIGPVNGEPAGLSAEQMDQYAQFALRIQYPPNPLRNVDDTLPDAPVPVRGSPFSGNPLEGERAYNEDAVDAGQPCRSCHAHPFGAAGGKLGGVTPTTPTSEDAAGMFNGQADQSNVHDLQVPHLRNMYEKIGPAFGDHLSPPPPAYSGIGFAHDGSVPDLGTFFSNNVFSMTAQQVRDVSAFLMHFPTGTKPAVGRQVTLPAGTPPTGTPDEEARLTDLIGDAAALPPKPTLGDLADAGRHCELVAATRLDGRARRFHLAAGLWNGDVAAEGPLTTTQLRESAEGPITFLCTTIGSGVRLGGDRDEDGFLDGDDCAAADPATWAGPPELGGLRLTDDGATTLSWDDASPATGPSLRYEVLGGDLSQLRQSGLAAATDCLAGDVADPGWVDVGADPPPGGGRFFLVRGTNACGTGSAGAGREALQALACAAP